MKKIIIFVILISISVTAYSQSKIAVYRFKTNVSDLFLTNERILKPHIAGKGTEFIFEVLDGEQYIIRITKAEEIPSSVIQQFDEKDSVDRDSLKPVSGQKYSPVESQETYTVDKEKIAPWTYELVQGLSVGALSVPFRLRIADTGVTLDAGGSISGFVGYEFNIGFVNVIAPLISVGLTTVPTLNLGTNDIEGSLGLSLAGGVAAVIGTDFQCGVIVGTDFISGEWEYNWMPWISIEMGYSFIN